MCTEVRGRLTQLDLDKKSGRLRKFGGTSIKLDLTLFTNKEIMDLFKHNSEINFIGVFNKRTFVVSSYLLD
jgi:hypothetical protein